MVAREQHVRQSQEWPLLGQQKLSPTTTCTANPKRLAGRGAGGSVTLASNMQVKGGFYKHAGEEKGGPSNHAIDQGCSYCHDSRFMAGQALSAGPGSLGLWLPPPAWHPGPGQCRPKPPWLALHLWRVPTARICPYATIREPSGRCCRETGKCTMQKLARLQHAASTTNHQTIKSNNHTWQSKSIAQSSPCHSHVHGPLTNTAGR